MMWPKRDFTMWISCLLFVTLFVYSKGQSYGAELCRSAKATSSCGFCTKAHPDCGWCTDRSFAGEYRCDIKENFRQTCAGQLVHQPPSKIEITQDRPLGSAHPYLPDSTQQLQPQQLQLTMKPGESLNFPLNYKHLDSQNGEVYILNSETASQGVTIAYTNSCPSFRQSDTEGRSCSSTRKDETITYNISITLNDCVTAGDAVVSIGIGGVRDVVALYITPVCGCDCEKLVNQELQSPTCNANGNLICGSCVCTGGKQGKHCDCDPDRESCTTRPTAWAPVDPCAGRTCPLYNGRECGGNGRCDCGSCSCNHGWTGQVCECSLEPCRGSDGKVCSDNGVCECGRCSCFDVSLRTPHCEDDTERPDEDHHPEGPPPHHPDDDDRESTETTGGEDERDESIYAPTDDPYDDRHHRPEDDHHPTHGPMTHDTMPPAPAHPEPEPAHPEHEPAHPEPEPEPEQPADPDMKAKDDGDHDHPTKEPTSDQVSLVDKNANSSIRLTVDCYVTFFVTLVGVIRFVFGSL